MHSQPPQPNDHTRATSGSATGIVAGSQPNGAESSEIYAKRAPGQVYALSVEERQEDAYGALILRQTTSETTLRAAIDAAILAISNLDCPLGWPALGYDLESTLSMLADLLPDRTAIEMARCAEELLEEG